MHWQLLLLCHVASRWWLLPPQYTHLLLDKYGQTCTDFFAQPSDEQQQQQQKQWCQHLLEVEQVRVNVSSIIRVCDKDLLPSTRAVGLPNASLKPFLLLLKSLHPAVINLYPCRPRHCCWQRHSSSFCCCRCCCCRVLVMCYLCHQAGTTWY